MRGKEWEGVEGVKGDGEIAQEVVERTEGDGHGRSWTGDVNKGLAGK